MANNTHQQAHIPVLLREAVHYLVQHSAGIYVDATFGRGGHARAILEQLDEQAQMIVLDRDPDAVEVARELAAADKRVSAHHAAFADLRAVLDALDIGHVQGVLMDLGVSSPQLDSAERGFSFRLEGPLDMRMDTSRGRSAARWLNEADEADIADVIFKHGEERFARRIARRIVEQRPLTTTQALAEVIQSAVPRRFHGGKHPATRSFQAIRIFINQEDRQLHQGLAAAFESLAVNGRLAVISFHSLEDRVVKQTFRQLSQPPSVPRRLPVQSNNRQVPGRKVAGPIRPGKGELEMNPRARSATLRVIERVGVT